MGNVSIVASSLATTAFTLLPFLTSCTTSDRDLFAFPAAPSATVSPASLGAGSTGQATSAIAKATPLLREFIGEDANRLRQMMGEKSDVQKTDHFVFVARQGSDVVPEVANLLEQTHRTFYEVFAGMSDQLSPIRDPLIWMVFDGRDAYERYAEDADGMDMSWAKAYYSAQTNRVAIALHNDLTSSLGQVQNPSSTTSTTSAKNAPAQAVIDGKLFSQITHEAGHQLAFNSGLQKRGVMYPLWCSEGLAANFEIDAKGNIGPLAGNALRTRHVLKAKAEDRLIPIDQWVSYSRVPVGRPAQITAVYGQAWAFFRFLYEHRRTELQDYLAHMAKQQPGRRSEETMKREFVHIFGEPEKLSEPWTKYLTDLAAVADEN